ncbi:hypothetical protein [Campylobacter gracilis]|uniref:Uncharacterized protein n=1 Tax=Campylobacter gracilis RM3268 TaxID=553220 RepID=C8PGM3_9BACT|nr:hypothetical protein [Campylobacter gracilis]AKT92530.1 hypothetical protein CGRAC_1081 [Campylobacter gracilis]EEV18261.1 hypothetical protein CAMGR0001_1018 [Campylobacter gracilis RM3268]UEB45287.1 hypothetical protein LK410_09920 [Campylobacter gracilis]SUW82047.1 Uncharacterised protein [Campylobacter gracilis]
MLKIDMLKFFRSGEFADVRRGLSCAQIIVMFGSADASFKSAEAEILRYGAFEFHFFRGEIFMIFSDHFRSEPLDLGGVRAGQIEIEPWILSGCPAPIDLVAAKDALDREQIEYRERARDDGFELDLNSGVTLAFESLSGLGESRSYELTAFWIKF